MLWRAKRKRTVLSNGKEGVALVEPLPPPLSCQCEHDPISYTHITDRNLLLQTMLQSEQLTP